MDKACKNCGYQKSCFPNWGPCQHCQRLSAWIPKVTTRVDAVNYAICTALAMSQASMLEAIKRYEGEGYIVEFLGPDCITVKLPVDKLDTGMGKPWPVTEGVECGLSMPAIAGCQARMQKPSVLLQLFPFKEDPGYAKRN